MQVMEEITLHIWLVFLQFFGILLSSGGGDTSSFSLKYQILDTDQDQRKT